MKISKLFHWLYALLMLMPFIACLIYTFINLKQGITSSNLFDSIFDLINDFSGSDSHNGLIGTINNIYEYLVLDLFGFDAFWTLLVINLLTYWTSISIIWLVFDVFLYVPLLAHRWIDKGVIE